MPEVETPPAAPSPAAEPQKQETPKAAEPVSVPTNAEDYAKWRFSGELPDDDTGRKPPKREDSATSKKPSVDDESESAAVSETAQQAGKRSAQKRIDQVIAEREAFRRENEELKAKAGKQDAKTPESSSVSQPPDLSKRPVKPKQPDFDSWGEYETAKDKYDEQLAEWKADQKIAEFIERTRREQHQREMQVKVDDAKARYGDDAEPMVLSTAQSVFDNGKIATDLKKAMTRSPVLVDALYVMGSDQAELQSFLDLAVNDPLEALRKFWAIETLVKQELGKAEKSEPNGATARGEDGKFVAAKPPARARQAPPPPTELGGTSSPPGDEADRAAANGDVRRFFSERNRKDVARWKGQI